MGDKRYKVNYELNGNQLDNIETILNEFLEEGKFSKVKVNGEDIFITQVTEWEFKKGNRPRGFKYSIANNNLEIEAWLYDYDFKMSPNILGVSLAFEQVYYKEIGLSGFYAMPFKKRYKKLLNNISEKIKEY